ncbi:TPA: hypothetical protein ACQFK7_000308 [Proteus mirabilis]|nr:hypothetical protein [Proteus mirabilis]MDF7282044.1 hypothetical protein [Proteus mirabilis]MDF7287100.1 hypothetical protein [Proteus mirabilis]MDF7375269.1 hypothetical protein [Proteus mirabilis]MDF7470879.1 hypothetical protein [Proteus mirabilis]UZE72743.1 hypothetical protein ONR66_08255 [Proteus mirabilis]
MGRFIMPDPIGLLGGICINMRRIRCHGWILSD